MRETLGRTVEEVGDEDTETTSGILVREQTRVVEPPTEDISAKDDDTGGVLRANGIDGKRGDLNLRSCGRTLLEETGNTVSARHEC